MAREAEPLPFCPPESAITGIKARERSDGCAVDGIAGGILDYAITIVVPRLLGAAPHINSHLGRILAVIGVRAPDEVA